MSETLSAPVCIRPQRTARKRVLCLGYDATESPLPDALAAEGVEVWHTYDRIQSTAGHDLVVSYGYRHLLRRPVIESSPAPIINLHIAYLPWNRGAHPNFWSFFDATPSGVTLHLIDEGIDTGPVLYQRYVNFAPHETTFTQTYQRLRQEIEALFIEHLEEIIEGRYRPRPQRRRGSYHAAADLPAAFSGWNADIETEIARLDALLGTGLKRPGDDQSA